MLRPTTKGLSMAVKELLVYWEEHTADRLKQAAEIAAQERELAEKKKKLGVG